MTRPDPSRIVVPRKHGEVLIEPGYPVLLEALRNSPFHVSSETQVPGLGHSLFQMRFMARRDLWGALTKHCRTAGLPLESLPSVEHRWIFTGHQVEFYHAGVWAKVLAADELARRSTASGTPAVAFDLLVDHDLIDHRGFSVPVQSDGAWNRKLVEYAPASPLSVDALQAPSREEFEDWDAAVARDSAVHSDAVAFFLSRLIPTQTPVSHTVWLSRARAGFEASMGVQVHHVPTSLLCESPSWFLFVSFWISQADILTALYNKHLAAYRQRQQIKNPQHPMPDLQRSVPSAGAAAVYELPFWIYRRGEPRERLIVQHEADHHILVVNGREFDVTGNFDSLLAQGYVLRPRALTLTMYTRLFLADVFIHGIGGALYDQITDGILDELFQMTPPYACVSAAWLLPLGQAVEEEDIGALRHRRHHACHNPQLVIDPFTALRTDVAEALRDRQQLIESISNSVATARRNPEARQRRRGWFKELHALNESLHQKAPRILANLDHQIATAEDSAANNKTLLWREYFFALHTVDSLKSLLEMIRRHS